MRKLREKLSKWFQSQYEHLRIGTKFMLIFLVVIFMVVVTVSSFLCGKAARMVKEETTTTLLGLLDQTAVQVDSVFDRVEDACFRMYTGLSLRSVFQQEPDDYPYRQQVEDYYTLVDIYSANMANRYIDGICMYFVNQGFYIDMQWACFSIEDAMQLPWYQKVQGKEGAHWVSYMDPRQPNEENFTISCIRAVSAGGEDQGYIEVKLNQKYLTDILLNMKNSVGGAMYMLTADQTVLASSESGYELGSKFADADALTGILESGESAREMRLENGEKMMLVVQTQGDMVYVAAVPLQVFRTTAEFVPFVLLLSAVALLVGMVMARALTANLTRRITELSQFLQTVSIEGNELAREQNHDEITELVRSSNKMLQMTRKLIREVYEVNLAKKETELMLLQAQINPHFLYNTLGSINWMANKRKAYDISKMTCLLADFFRQSLKNGENVVTIRDELAHVRTYLEIMQLRYEGAIHAFFEVEENLLEQKIVKLILQPIVENAVLHGLMEKDEPGGLISIHVKKVEQEIHFLIEDDGVGMPPETLYALQNESGTSVQSSGYGLRNVRDRIRLNYGAAYGLQISSTQYVGTKVEIHLPDQGDSITDSCICPVM
jgi:two-component system sensor histidine kinase YesM